MFDQYLDTKEMKVIMLPNLDTGVGDLEDEDEELMAQVEDDEENRYYALPSQYDIHEYRIMEDYIDELDDDRLTRELSRTIRAKVHFGDLRIH